MSRRTDRLLKENNRLEQQLRDGHNQSVLTDITVYLRSANISPYEQELVRRDIGEMLAEGERRGETAREIIGDDCKAFCDQVIAQLPRLGGTTRILSWLRDILLAAAALVTIWFGSNLLGHVMSGTVLPYFTVTVGNLLSALLCIVGALLVFYGISKSAFSPSRSSGFKVYALLMVLLVLCTVINAFLIHPLFRLHVLAAIGGIVLLLAAYKLLDAKLD